MVMPVRDLMRAINRAKIIEIIRTEEMISRGDLASGAGLSKASVTGITADLIGEGLVIEKKSGKYDGGRRPMLLALNPEGAYVLGVNLSVTEIRVVLVNLAADLLASYSYPLKSVAYTVEEIADIMVSAVQACMWKSNLSKDCISGVGIGVPGPVYSETGVIRFLPNYGWENVNLRDLVQQRLELPCYIDNSSNTLAAAERWFGAGKGVDNFLVVTVLNGVGLGIVINGQIYRGVNGTGGELGHITIDPNGPPCRCGKSGCLESFAGMNAIIRDVNASLQEHGKPMQSLTTFNEVLAELETGSISVAEVFKQAGKVLGYGVSHLISLFNPEKIIVTGTVVQVGDVFFDSFKEALRANTPSMVDLSEKLIVIQPWDDKQWALGAGSMVLEELYRSPLRALSGDS